MGKGVESGTRDLYEVLDVLPSAPEAEIRSAFRRLAAEYHPDRNAGPHAAIHFKRVNAAYQVLVDAERRAAYDALTGQVDPAPALTDGTEAPPRPSAPEGWYLTREGSWQGPVPPEVIVNWIAGGLREGMVRFGSTGEWRPLGQSLFAKFIPQQSLPPPPSPPMAIANTYSLPPPPLANTYTLPPRLLFVSEPELGRKGKYRMLKILGAVLLVVLIILSFALRASCVSSD